MLKVKGKVLIYFDQVCFFIGNYVYIINVECINKMLITMKEELEMNLKMIRNDFYIFFEDGYINRKILLK